MKTTTSTVDDGPVTCRKAVPFTGRRIPSPREMSRTEFDPMAHQMAYAAQMAELGVCIPVIKL